MPPETGTASGGVFCRITAGRQIVVWRAVPADNSSQTASNKGAAIGPLDQHCGEICCRIYRFPLSLRTSPQTDVAISVQAVSNSPKSWIKPTALPAILPHQRARWFAMTWIFITAFDIFILQFIPPSNAEQGCAGGAPLLDVDFYTVRVHSVMSRPGTSQTSWYSSTLVGVSSSVEPR